MMIKMTSLLLAAFLLVAPAKIVAEPAATHSVLKSFPSTVEEVEQFQKLASSEFEEARKLFKEQSASRLNYHTLLSWNKLVETLVSKQVILTYLPLTTSKSAVLEKAKLAAQYLDQKVDEACRDEKVISLFLAYAKQAEGLNPSQIYVLNKFLESMVEGLPPSHPLMKEALALYSKLSLKETLPFTYAKGDAVEKTLPADKKIVILSWNVCCFNEGISMLFGGVLPWQNRMDRLAAKLEKSEADLICLQEVFSREAAEALTLKLKKKYAHFYLNIGPKVYGFDKAAFGIPSGLFIASKYPLSHPTFRPYDAEETPKIRGYGFFSAEIKSQKGTTARLIATHLQPGSTAQDRQFRHNQLQALLNSMDSKTPTFIFGDLNIERDSEEYLKEITPHFVNRYRGSDWTCCELRNYWWKAEENVNKFLALGLLPEWIDYFLCLKNHSYESVKSVDASIFSVNQPSNPKESLSDHQGIVTSIIFKE
jgi:endonuclease/exonuclease/phosphatase family metal-dependent hydrolase